MRLGRPSTTIDTVLLDQSFTLSESEEQQYWRKTGQCPRCQKRILYTTTYESNGRVRRVLAPKDPASLAECPRCHERWFWFTPPLRIAFSEGDQSVEEVYVKEIVLDNTRGVSPLLRKQTLSEEWTQSYEVEREETDTQGTNLKAGLEKGPSIEVTAEQAVKERYSISEQKKEVYTEELSFEVPPGVRRTVNVSFKQTWQTGKITLSPLDAGTKNLDETRHVELPFRVVIDVTMDLAQTDSSAPAGASKRPTKRSKPGR